MHIHLNKKVKKKKSVTSSPQVSAWLHLGLARSPHSDGLRKKLYVSRDLGGSDPSCVFQWPKAEFIVT